MYVSVTPIYMGPELVVSLKSPTSQYLLAGWDVGVIESTASDLLSSATVFNSQLSYTDIDFFYAQRVVYTATDNGIICMQATTGQATIYQAGADSISSQ